jgi:hypothetical protein
MIIVPADRCDIGASLESMDAGCKWASLTVLAVSGVITLHLL